MLMIWPIRRSRRFRRRWTLIKIKMRSKKVKISNKSYSKERKDTWKSEASRKKWSWSDPSVVLTVMRMSLCPWTACHRALEHPWATRLRRVTSQKSIPPINKRVEERLKTRVWDRLTSWKCQSKISDTAEIKAKTTLLVFQFRFTLVPWHPTSAYEGFSSTAQVLIFQLQGMGGITI